VSSAAMSSLLAPITLAVYICQSYKCIPRL